MQIVKGPMKSTMKNTTSALKTWIDRFGIALSSLCLLHCLSGPLALIILPVVIQAPIMGVLHESEWVHAALLVPIILVSGPVLIQGAKAKRYIGYLGFLGIASLCSALFIHEELAEQIVTAAGTLMLITAHIVNLRGRRALAASYHTLKTIMPINDV